jgi:MerR family copper efflux transcriptional regulator
MRRREVTITYTIGQLAEQAGVKVATLRYYERRGLLPEPPRRDSGYREYGEENVARIDFIKNAQALGFSLKEIQELLKLRVDPTTTCEEVTKQGEIKLAQIADKIRALQRMQDALVQLLAVCNSGSPHRQCRLLDTFHAEGPGCHRETVVEIWGQD